MTTTDNQQPLATDDHPWPTSPALGLFQFTERATGESVTWLVLRTDTDPATGERWAFLAHPDDPSQAELKLPRDYIRTHYRVVPA